MKELKIILDENSGVRLNHLEYKRIEESEGESNLYLEDKFEISEVNKDFFSILVYRHIYCDPKDMMDIVVEFEIARYLAEGCNEDLREYDIEAEVKKDIDYYIDYNLNRASGLISAVTSSFGLNPLVTPPQFLEIEDEE